MFKTNILIYISIKTNKTLLEFTNKLSVFLMIFYTQDFKHRNTALSISKFSHYVNKINYISMSLCKKTSHVCTRRYFNVEFLHKIWSSAFIAVLPLKLDRSIGLLWLSPQELISVITTYIGFEMPHSIGLILLLLHHNPRHITLPSVSWHQKGNSQTKIHPQD
jgi:hypothetical protein